VPRYIHARRRARARIGPMLVVAVLVLAVWVQGATANASSLKVECAERIVSVHEDGTVEVNTTMTVNSTSLPATVYWKAIGVPIFASATDKYTGAPLPVAYNNSTLIAVTVPDNTTVDLYYVTQTVTSKQGEYWLLEVSGASCPTVVVLPGDAIPVEVTPANPRPVLVNGTPGLLFYSKNISIKYILSPSISTGTGGFGGTTSQGGGPGGHGRNNILKTAVIALSIIVAGAGLYLYYQARKRRSSKTPGTLEKQEVQVRIGLDDRDRLILDALKDGEKTASELMTLTGIPKTPLYRRLKKLLEAGLIEAVDEGGQRVYRLKVEDKK